MRRATLLAVAMLAAAPAFAAGPPRGKRSEHPKATHVVVTDATLDSGAERPVTLAAGTPVALRGAKPGLTPAGKTAKVTVADSIELAGALPSGDLGLRVLHDIDARAKADDPAAAGRLRAGSLVRVRALRGKIAEVETVGPIAARLFVDAGALGTDPVTLVLPDAAGQRLAALGEEAELYADEKLTASRARLGKGARVLLLEEKGQAVHVRSYGGYELDGWMFIDKLDVLPVDKIEPAVRRVPSHDVFVDTPIFAASDRKKRLGQLRGGALVSIVQKPKDGLALVETLGPVRAEGWVSLSDLEELAASVWNEPP